MRNFAMNLKSEDSPGLGFTVLPSTQSNRDSWWMKDGGRADGVRQGRSVAAVFPEEHEMVRGRRGREMGVRKGIAKCGAKCGSKFESGKDFRINENFLSLPRVNISAHLYKFVIFSLFATWTNQRLIPVVCLNVVEKCCSYIIFLYLYSCPYL
ncbi:hypothetical protein V8G54_007473, partial [Vigna mungo]